MPKPIRLLVTACLVLGAWTAAFGAPWTLDLPDGAVGWKFGSLIVPPLKNVLATTAWSDEAGFGLVGAEGLQQGGGAWPDPLTGSYVAPGAGKTLRFKAKVPDGEYWVWLAAGKIIRGDAKDRRFLLKVGEGARRRDAHRRRVRER